MCGERKPCGYCKRRIMIAHASFVVRGIPFCNRYHFLAWELANGQPPFPGWEVDCNQDNAHAAG